MRIVFVNATKRWGGVKTWMLTFAESLVSKGHSVRIYGRQPEFIQAAQQRIGHGELVHFGPDLNPFAIKYFCKTFHDADVVFVNIEKGLATAGVAAKLLGIPLVQRIGLPEDIAYRLKTSLIHRWINPFFLSPCHFIERGFLKSLPYIDPARSHVVLTGKKAVSWEIQMHSPLRLVATQQLNPAKDHATLLRALAKIPQPWELHIAGTGKIEQELKSLAHDLGLDGKVIWHGFVRDIPAFLQQGDIFLLASLSEGLPNTLLEALAAGLLPIIRDVGGVREVMPDSLESWILPYTADDNTFRTAIEKALNLSETEMLTLRHEARASRDRYFDIDKQTDELIEWLEEVVKEKKRR